MTTLKGVTRHYDQLSPEERFRLSMLAVARGDEAENDRLIQTCPKRVYRMNDPAFSGRCTAAYHLVEGLVGELTYYAGWLAAFEVLAEPLGKAIVALLGDRANGDAEGNFPLYAPRGLEIGHRTMLTRMKVVWEAFTTVCHEDAGIGLEVLLAVWSPPIWEAIAARQEEWAELEVDPAEVAELREKFGEVWRVALREVGA